MNSHFQRVGPAPQKAGFFFAYDTSIQPYILFAGTVCLFAIAKAHIQSTFPPLVCFGSRQIDANFLSAFLRTSVRQWSASGCPQGHDSYHYMPPAPLHLFGRGLRPRQTQWRTLGTIQQWTLLAQIMRTKSAFQTKQNHSQQPQSCGNFTIHKIIFAVSAIILSKHFTSTTLFNFNLVAHMF